MRSIYYWHVVNTSGPSILCIVDCGYGHALSVTNDMENVLKDLGERMYLNDMLIIYSDSDGIWDGVSLVDASPKGFDFYSLHERTEHAAIVHALKRHIKPRIPL
jgi:hypothetical protein